MPERLVPASCSMLAHCSITFTLQTLNATAAALASGNCLLSIRCRTDWCHVWQLWQTNSRFRDTEQLGLYQIYFFQSDRSRILPDLEWQIRPKPDFQIFCNFTNLMCKKITNVRVIWVFGYFLCSSYHYDFLNIWISYLFRPTSWSYYSSKLSNVWEKSTFQIR